MIEIAALRLEDYGGLLRRRLWLVVLAAVLAGLAAYGYSIRQPPVFRASVSVSVTPNVIDYWTMQAVERLLNTYTDRLLTWSVAERVVAQKQLDIDPGAALGQVRAIAAPSSFRVILQGESTDPHRAVALANGFAEEFVQLARAEQSSGPGGEVFLRPQVLSFASAATQVGPRSKLNTAAGTALGVLVGILFALVAEFTDDRLRTVREVEHVVGAPVLARIPSHLHIPAVTASRRVASLAAPPLDSQRKL